MHNRNLTLLTDLYQLTMMQGYFNTNNHQKLSVYDMFYRKNPCENGYAIFCGLEQVIHYIKNIKFTDEDILYLRSLNLFSQDFLRYLKDFKFSGEIYSVEEGTVVFPYEPLIRVKATVIEAQFIETTILNIINHQTLIATKAARVVQACDGDTVLEFGLRRAQAPDAGIYGTRACIIGGCNATSNILAGKLFDIPISGTHGHSWVMSFNEEITAFREYAKNFPNKCILLVDTYNTLTSGVPNAIKVFNEMKEMGIPLKNYGIRLDSGDLSYISKEARKMLDDAGFFDAIIIASNDLDEYIISSLKQQNSCIDAWGVGTSLITSKGCPALGGVYKLAMEESEDGSFVPKIKVSDNKDKITNPGIKKIIRVYDSKTKKIKADLIALDDEVFDENNDLTIIHPLESWKKMKLKTGEYFLRELLKPIFINGECIYKSKSVLEIRDYCNLEKETLWSQHKRLINPQTIPVDLSERLLKLKNDMLKEV